MQEFRWVLNEEKKLAWVIFSDPVGGVLAEPSTTKKLPSKNSFSS